MRRFANMMAGLAAAALTITGAAGMSVFAGETEVSTAASSGDSAETSTEAGAAEAVTIDVSTLDASSLEGKSITVMTPYMGSVTTNHMVNYLMDELKTAGADANLVSTDNDFGELASRIEDVASAGTDAIVLVSADPAQLANQLQEAFDAGIPVYGIDSGFIDGMAVNATSDNYAMGSQTTHYLFDDLMGGKGTVIALTHRPHPGIAVRCKAFDEILEEYPDITLITEQHVPAEQPINDAQDIVANLLLSNPEPGSITGIWAAWDEAAIGATQALQEAGRDEVAVIGLDGNEQAVSLIEKGTNLKATLKQNFDGMCDIVYDQLIKLFNGDETATGELYSPATLITQENAAEVGSY